MPIWKCIISNSSTQKCRKGNILSQEWLHTLKSKHLNRGGDCKLGSSLSYVRPERRMGNPMHPCPIWVPSVLQGRSRSALTREGAAWQAIPQHRMEFLSNMKTRFTFPFLSKAVTFSLPHPVPDKARRKMIFAGQSGTNWSTNLV